MAETSTETKPATTTAATVEGDKKTVVDESQSKEKVVEEGKITIEEANCTDEMDVTENGTVEENSVTKEDDKGEAKVDKKEDAKGNKDDKKTAKTTEERNEKTVKDYLDELVKEKESIDAKKFPKIIKLIDKRISSLKERGKRLNVVELMGNASSLTERVYIPTIGKRKPHTLVAGLIGTKGKNVRDLERLTKTRITVRGIGSNLDKAKEDKMRNYLDPKYDHLAEGLHLEIVTTAVPDEAHQRMANAIKCLKSYFSGLETDRVVTQRGNVSSPWANGLGDSASTVLVPATYQIQTNYHPNGMQPQYGQHTMIPFNSMTSSPGPILDRISSRFNRRSSPYRRPSIKGSESSRKR